MKTESGQITKRTIMGSIVFYVLLAGLYFGSWVLIMFMGFLWWQITSEFINIVRKKEINPSNLWIRFVSLGFLIAASLPYFGYKKDLVISLFMIIFLFGVIGCFSRLVLRGGKNEKIATITDISTSVLGFIYTGLLPNFLLLLQQLGYQYALITCFSTAMCDVGAYVGGKIFGKHTLRPDISPKKTLEGSICGFIFSILSAVFIYSFSKEAFNYSIIHPIIIGIFCGTLSQLGDLFESLLKRDAGVKDSGTILQSHGGLLDRIDGYLFVLWIVYFYVRWFILFDPIV